MTGIDAAEHNRGASDQHLVYPVLSRRAGGLSIGINLNPDQTCNWSCVYCEVDGLHRGRPPAIDLDALSAELDRVLARAQAGEFRVDGAPAAVVDLSIAGDGEPTLSPVFSGAVERVVRARDRAGLADQAPLVVITNGTQIDNATEGLQTLGAAGGELWFKLDAGTRAARGLISGVPASDESCIDALHKASLLARTEVHTMVLRIDGTVPCGVDAPELTELIRASKRRGAKLDRAVVYGLARPSMQPERARLSPATHDELSRVAGRFEAAGLAASIVL